MKIIVEVEAVVTTTCKIILTVHSDEPQKIERAVKNFCKGIDSKTAVDVEDITVVKVEMPPEPCWGTGIPDKSTDDWKSLVCSLIYDGLPLVYKKHEVFHEARPESEADAASA